MKKIYITITLLLSIVALSSCGGGGSGGSNGSVYGDSSSGVVTMQTGVTYQVYSGNQVVPVNSSTVISVSHVLNDSTKYVTLLSGSATLLRGSYATN